MFNNSGSLRTISSPFQRGARSAHWPELALAETQYKIQLHRHNPPRPSQLLHLLLTLNNSEVPCSSGNHRSTQLHMNRNNGNYSPPN